MSRFLTADWRSLLMLNYEVAPEILRSYVPCGTELDDWQGRYYVSIVGLMFLKTRVLGWRIPLHENFAEVNLRFYVRRKGPEGWRRGVVFIKEIVPRRMVALAARAIYNEQYVAYRMRHSRRSGDLEYSWHFRGEWHGIRARTSGEAQEAVEGSREEFITEHYWGYTMQRDLGCLEYRVEHPRWPILRASESALTANVAELYGDWFVDSLSMPPVS
ncbi:MAG: YqjF family protein, partial [Bryobacteraceae bacterium]